MAGKVDSTFPFDIATWKTGNGRKSGFHFSVRHCDVENRQWPRKVDATFPFDIAGSAGYLPYGAAMNFR